MHCADCIRQMPERVRNDWFQKELSADGDSQEFDIGQIILRLTDPACLEQRYWAMHDREKRTLAEIIKIFAGAPFEWEALKQAAGKMLTEAELKIGLVGLQLKGVIFAMRKAWGNSVFILPEDTSRFWLKLVFPVETWQVDIINTDETLLNASDTSQFPALFHYLLRLLNRAAKQDLSLTKTGCLHKRHLKKLSAEIELDNEILSHLSFHYKHREVYPPSFAMIYDIALRMGILYEDTLHGRVRIHRPALKEWLGLSNVSLLTHIYQLWRAVYTPNTSWVRLVSYAMEEVQPQQWISIRGLANGLLKHRIPCNTSDIKQLMELIRQKWVGPLLELGFMQSTTSEAGEEYVKWAIASSCGLESRSSAESPQLDELPGCPGLIQGSFYVQPDFEIIVPPYTSLAVRWELECIAQFIRSDVVCLYHITKESITHALEEGRTADDIISFLQAGAKYGVSENIAVMIQSWARSVGMLNVHAGEAGSSAIPPVSDSLIQEKINAGIVFARFAPQFYELDVHLPSIDEVFPKLHEIPGLWLKEPRAYHISTRKEIFEKAIGWGTYVKIRSHCEDGCEDVVFAPTMVIQQQMDWCVIGYEKGQEIRFDLEQCREMQLILPGINDKY